MSTRIGPGFVARGAVALGLSLCALSVPVSAVAVTPPSCGPPDAPAAVCPPAGAQPQGTALVNVDGTVTVTVQGQFTWSTDPLQVTDGQAGGDACGGNYGLGWAMAWNDPKDPGAVTVSSNTVSEALGSAGNALNPADTAVHYNADAPCGAPQTVTDPVSGLTQTVPAGSWGPSTVACTLPEAATSEVATCPATAGHPSTAPPLALTPTSHTYASAADLPAEICVNLYVLGHPYTAGDANYTLTQPLNAVSMDEFDATVGAGWCFAPAISAPSPSATSTPTPSPAAPPVLSTPHSRPAQHPSPSRKQRTAQFTVTETADHAGSVPTNTPVTYTITVQNTGRKAGAPGVVTDSLALETGQSAVVVTAPTPTPALGPAVTGAATGATITAPGASWSWDLSGVSFSPSFTASLSLTVQPTVQGTMVNTAALPGSTCVAGGTAATCQSSTPVMDLLLSKLAKVVGGRSDNAVETLQYTINLQNPTDNDAANIALSDSMSSSVAAVTPSVARASFAASPSIAGNSVTCTSSTCTGFNWTWPVVFHHTTATLVYEASIPSTSPVRGTVTVTNQVSGAHLTPAAVSNSAVLSGVQAATTTGRSPNAAPTGAASELNVRMAAIIFSCGLASIALGIALRRRRPVR
jgi:uncharacterized repeat protein (TIGR01451 family)